MADVGDGENHDGENLAKLTHIKICTSYSVQLQNNSLFSCNLAVSKATFLAMCFG